MHTNTYICLTARSRLPSKLYYESKEYKHLVGRRVPPSTGNHNLPIGSFVFQKNYIQTSQISWKHMVHSLTSYNGRAHCNSMSESEVYYEFLTLIMLFQIC